MSTLKKDLASTQQVLLPQYLQQNKQIVIGTILTSAGDGLTSADVSCMRKLQSCIPHHILLLMDDSADKAKRYQLFYTYIFIYIYIYRHVYLYTYIYTLVVYIYIHVYVKILYTHIYKSNVHI